MDQDFFTYLPPEITMNILSRLPVRTAVSCKCVRKSWRCLIGTPEFVKSYKSVPSLAVFEGETSSIPYKVYELEDELNLENFKNPCNVAFKFSLPQPMFIRSSANGLLLLSDLSVETANLAICNPVTREYINLPAPSLPTRRPWVWLGTYAFGATKTTGQYKIVGVFREAYDIDCENSDVLIPRLDKESYCQVYTLGTGLWRSIAPTISLNCVGAFLNGNLHWLSSDLRGSLWISCFDLETELLSTLSPRLDAIIGRDGLEGHDVFGSLFALRGCLGLCDNSDNQLVIWLMNTYGDGESWTKQFVFAKTMPCRVIHRYTCVLKVFKDGDIMMKSSGRRKAIICYSNKTKSIQETDLIELRGDGDPTCAVCYTPSFVPLKTFAMENVSTF